MTDFIHHCLAPRGSLTLSSETFSPQTQCSCCGEMGTSVSASGAKLCIVCAPAFCVDEPDTDKVSTLIWLPQIDQGFVSRLLRSAYQARYVPASSPPAAVERASRAYDILTELENLRSVAKQIIGTDRISVLRKLIPEIPQYNLFLRSKRVSGLRVLPLAPWFDFHGEDFRALSTSRK